MASTMWSKASANYGASRRARCADAETCLVTSSPGIPTSAILLARS